MEPNRLDREDADDDPWSDDPVGCCNCDEGMIVVCMDDLCRNSGWCMHGDGMAVCPTCRGERF